MIAQRCFYFYTSSVVHRGSILVSVPLKCNQRKKLLSISPAQKCSLFKKIWKRFAESQKSRCTFRLLHTVKSLYDYIFAKKRRECFVELVVKWYLLQSDISRVSDLIIYDNKLCSLKFWILLFHSIANTELPACHLGRHENKNLKLYRDR